MSQIVIFNEEMQSLSEVSFVREAGKLTKIREANGYELSKEASRFITNTTNALGIKEATSSFNKQDIIELLITKYRNLTIDEVYYAFKMERYGNLGERIEHFQLFNAEYVSKVLDKWVNRKREVKRDHNILDQPKQKTATEKEKLYWINRGVTECIEYYEENGSVMDGKLYLYDVLYDLGYLPSDAEYKNKMYAQAVEVVKFETESLKPKSIKEKKELKSILDEISLPKSPKVILKAKELVLLEFFRNTFKDAEKVEELKSRFRNE